MVEQKRARRDPRGRRQAIIDAAVALVSENGVDELTHRRVAARAQVSLGATTYYFSSLDELKAEALARLAQRLDESLDQIRDALAAGDGDPAALATWLHDYLNDTAQVRIDSALTFSAANDAELRPLALSWTERMAEILAPYTDAETARTIAVFCDGTIVHALLHDEPLDAEFLRRAITALMRPGGRA
ncbi:transcriptional regulator, TetR family [Saccharopolyspora kobensis]|uniref:Transcriptional regulator, TetR family n=1 Tax=Saccharopolyspora kobensis TaxID=146035 RepID=A0A1H6DT40_9PSEU|nr:TetR family transcriptional regulator [Saccharopolyspora kobensis]SEG88408.1 transcriptional regulator, TetR family [Saccharopolyspora kobensis]SFE01201.1 transcriptional regulator, TetR family [Saccharopolyspora kobensis]